MARTYPGAPLSLSHRYGPACARGVSTFNRGCGLRDSSFWAEVSPKEVRPDFEEHEKKGAPQRRGHPQAGDMENPLRETA